MTPPARAATPPRRGILLAGSHHGTRRHRHGSQRTGQGGSTALEFHIITSREFLRLGAHGELDWPRSLDVLRTIAKQLVDSGTTLAMLDLRDARVDLSETHVKALAVMLQGIGFREHHRLAILHVPHALTRPPAFVDAAKKRGFNVERFATYETAAEWLSRPDGKDPDFDRETYLGPGGHKAPGVHPPPEGPA